MFRSSQGTHERRPALSEAERAPVVVYGTDWCAQTMAARRYLDRTGVPYVFRNMDTDPQAAAQVKWWNGGYASHPTIQIGGQILVEPSMDELRWTLAQEGLI